MEDEKYYVIVSNNQRNRALPTVLVARITSSDKPELRSIVAIPENECVYGRILCDDIVEMWPEDDVRQILGGLSVTTMAAVDDGLKAAFGLD
nr:type II toxin-antitoxin system PemK/MazF family toxin [Arthrobacter sp. VKM Ac-2550]